MQGSGARHGPGRARGARTVVSGRAVRPCTLTDPQTLSPTPQVWGLVWVVGFGVRGSGRAQGQGRARGVRRGSCPGGRREDQRQANSARISVGSQQLGVAGRAGRARRAVVSVVVSVVSSAAEAGVPSEEGGGATPGRLGGARRPATVSQISTYVGTVVHCTVP